MGREDISAEKSLEQPGTLRDSPGETENCTLRGIRRGAHRNKHKCSLCGNGDTKRSIKIQCSRICAVGVSLFAPLSIPELFKVKLDLVFFCGLSSH